MSKIPFFKFFSNSKFSVLNVNRIKLNVGWGFYPNINNEFQKSNSCHPELVSGSYHRQKFSTICAQKSNVGQVCPTCNNISLNSKERSIIVQCLRPHSPRKLAFTLAEVLITLGIIGVVAAMTLPTLIANYQKQETISKLQKVYTILNQAFKLSEVDNGEFEYWTYNGPEEYFEKYWKPYFKIAKMCNTYKECDYSSVTPFISLRGIYDNTVTVVEQNQRRTFITTDGMVLIISISTGSGTGVDPVISNLNIFIDINGSNRPNQYGKDVFITDVTAKGVLAKGYDLSTDEVNRECSKSEKGEYCLSKILRDGWKIKDDYPW